MLQSVSVNSNNSVKFNNKPQNSTVTHQIQTVNCANNTNNIITAYGLSRINTTLSPADKDKYLYLMNFLRDIKPSRTSNGLTPSKQLDLLLKNGKLLAKSQNDNSTTLDNLYDIATNQRAENLDAKKIITDTLDIIVNPRFVTQNFGDIPNNEVQNVLMKQNPNSEVVANPNLMNVFASGTCCAASNEVNMADKYPAEMARWISKLTSSEKELFLNTDLKTISKDPLEASTILKILGADNKSFNYRNNKIRVTLDDNAYLRANIQSDYWDEGERNIADVIIQSAIMRLGSQNTYDSLTDTREAVFNSNTQGLVEFEKTFVESLIKNKEITSLVYQKIDDNQNLVGYTCSFNKIAKHITDTIDSGDDVIIGYVLTNETAGVTKDYNYNPKVQGLPNQIINGHEITIVDYIKDKSGKINFVCVDTDDDSKDFVIYNSDWLLPKIHHAGYPAQIVKDDEKAIMSQVA